MTDNMGRLPVDPITTPDYPDPTPLARHVLIGDRTTTLYLETAAWVALCRIACEQGRTIDDLCTEITGACAPDASFAQAARYYLFDHIAAFIPDSQLPPEIRDLRRHGYLPRSAGTPLITELGTARFNSPRRKPSRAPPGRHFLEL